jgi:hypothetical protein
LILSFSLGDRFVNHYFLCADSYGALFSLSAETQWADTSFEMPVLSTPEQGQAWLFALYNVENKAMRQKFSELWSWSVSCHGPKGAGNDFQIAPRHWPLPRAASMRTVVDNIRPFVGEKGAE